MAITAHWLWNSTDTAAIRTLMNNFLSPRMRMHGRPLCSTRFSFVLFERHPQRPPNETQPNFGTCLEVSQIWKEASKIWDFLPLKRRPQNYLFSDSQFTTTSRVKREYHVNKTNYWQTEILLNHKRCPTFPKNWWTLAVNGWDYIAFWRTLCKFCIF